MVIHAHTHNMVCDSYNERRLSVQQEGTPIEKSPSGRPFAAGPNCIMKKEDEHVTVILIEYQRHFVRLPPQNIC